MGNIFKQRTAFALAVFMFSSFQNSENSGQNTQSPYLIVLGSAQDGGYPQSGCNKPCCREVWNNRSLKKLVSCIGIVDPVSGERWMIDATPDFREQLRLLQKAEPASDTFNLTGIFLTHGHIGHYTGLMHLGREAMGTKNVNVYAMPRMKSFLERNGPWEQLVKLNNISIRSMKEDSTLHLNTRISVIPFVVPHRDEYTETVGFRIKGVSKSIVFIPDIDKWEKWNVKLEEVIKSSDAVFIDGTFYAEGELPGRPMKEVPHPFMTETMELLKNLPVAEKSKVFFIHFNHTNPALIKNSDAQKNIKGLGFQIAEEKQLFSL